MGLTMVNDGLSGGLSGGLYYIYISGWWCNTHLEKYEVVNVKDDIPDITENCFKGLKPPTSNLPIEIANG
jgi:hypothetical protein